MTLKRLKERAAKAQELQRRVLRWRLSHNFTALFAYLFWRNRYPLLTKICSRMLLLLELYIIYDFFHLSLAANFGLIFFILYYCKELQRGLVQATRKILLTKGVFNSADLNNLLALSSVFGLCIPGLIFLTSNAFGFTLFGKLFCCIWILLYPLQLCSGSLWGVVYIYQRLPRNFSVIIFCRLLPIITLLLLADKIGAYAYLIGLLCSRAAEYLYLIKVAAKFLIDFKGWKPLAKLSKFDYKFIFNYQTSFAGIVSCYFLFSGLLLFIYDSRLWFNHFFINYTLLLLLYLVLRLPQSLSQDFYMALNRANIKSALLWYHRSKKSLILALLFSSVLASIPSFFDSTLVYWRYFPILILLLCGRSFFYFKILFIQSSLLEQYNFKRFFASLFIFGLSLQLLFTFYWRGDLVAFYLSEVLALGLAALTASTKFILGHVYSQALNKYRQQLKIPATEHLSNLNFNPNLSDIWIVSLDPYFLKGANRVSMLMEIIKELPEVECSLPLNGLIYIFVARKNCNFESRIYAAFAGVVRTVYCWDSNKDYLLNLTKMLASLRRAHLPSSSYRRFLSTLERIIAGKLVLSDNFKLPTQPERTFDFLNPEHNNFRSLPLMQLKIADRLTADNSLPALMPIIPKPYLLAGILGNYKYLFNCAKLPTEEMLLLEEEVLKYNLNLIVNLFCTNRK